MEFVFDLLVGYVTLDLYYLFDQAYRELIK
jgi:hypothetical protein